MSCKKAQEVLEKEKVTPVEEINARKEAIDEDKAWKLLSGCTKVIIAKGKKILEFIPTDDIKDQILKDAMGRSGNLRAPTLMVGSSCFVGFNQEMYETLISSAS